jgi:alanine racemase
MSHLASADEDVAQNSKQLARFNAMSAGVTAQRRSLANSAGIVLGSEYHFDLTRPGLSLYGGHARPELAKVIQPVVHLSAQILQIRELAAGDPVGYNATYVCGAPMRVATAAIGYADGYMRGFSGKGMGLINGLQLPLIGRVSMDLVTLDASRAPDLQDGDWVDIMYNLPEASNISGLSQYELLTGLGRRAIRDWFDGDQ